jgi:glutathione S-transferase
MITLFHAPKSRSSRMIFLLEELQVPYEIKLVTIRRRDGSGALDPANPHPHGKVPTISDDGTVVFESPAIALYLTDQYPKNHLGPLVGEPERGDYLTWLSYYSGVLEPAIVSKFSEPGSAARYRRLPKSPLIEQYVQRIVSRSAYARAQARDNG